MQCKCGGVLVTIRVEDFPKDLTAREKIHYNRVCDVECQECGEIYYSQPYDSGNLLNLVKEIKR